MNSYRFAISNWRENKFCSHEVSFRLHFKITRYSDGYVGISFRVVFTRYFITRNEISFLSKWPIWNRYPHWVLNAPSNESALIHFVSGKLRSQENLKPVWNFVSVKIKRYETHTVLSFILPQFMGTQVKSWLNTEVRFSTEMKSHTGLNSFRLSCERTFKVKITISKTIISKTIAIRITLFSVGLKCTKLIERTWSHWFFPWLLRRLDKMVFNEIKTIIRSKVYITLWT